MVKNFKQGVNTFKTIFKGMGITIRHFFGPSVTLQYPDERDILPKRARSRLFVNIDDCIGCNLCARACPVNCIDIETVKAGADEDLGTTSNGKQKRLWISQFDIDMAKCMYCDLCVYPCPTECIYMVQEYEFSEFDRSNLLYKFSDLSSERVTEVKETAKNEAEEAEKKKAEAAAAKTAKAPDDKPARVPGRVPGKVPGGAARVPGSVPGGGKAQVPGGGAAQIPGSGAKKIPGSGAARIPGGGAKKVSGSGAAQVPGGGAKKVPGSGAAQVPGSGVRKVPGGGAPKVPGKSTGKPEENKNNPSANKPDKEEN